EVRIEGFRTSLTDVATFRFSSVADSYAGRKGKARNVGVIAVAIFEEQAPPREPQLVVPHITHRHDRDIRHPYGGAGDRARKPSVSAERGEPAGEAAPSVGAGGAPARPKPPTATAQTTRRPGLGTEF